MCSDVLLLPVGHTFLHGVLHVQNNRGYTIMKNDYDLPDLFLVLCFPSRDRSRVVLPLACTGDCGSSPCGQTIATIKVDRYICLSLFVGNQCVLVCCSDPQQYCNQDKPPDGAPRCMMLLTRHSQHVCISHTCYILMPIMKLTAFIPSSIPTQENVRLLNPKYRSPQLDRHGLVWQRRPHAAEPAAAASVRTAARRKSVLSSQANEIDDRRVSGKLGVIRRPGITEGVYGVCSTGWA